MRNPSVIGRTAAIAAVALAVVAVAAIVLRGGSSYKVNAIFENASQIVTGDLVQVSGNNVGTVSNISLTPSGQAKLTLSINDSTFNELRQGTIATVREVSLSGIANRYVDLRLGPATGTPIPNNGTIPTGDTASEVDLDEVLDTLDAPTRRALQGVIQGSAAQYAKEGQKMQAAWQYLNPAIASSSVLFHEINRDTNKFTHFIVNSSNLVSDIATRRSDLAGLVQNLSSTTGALARQHTALGESIQQLPGFMALADTTFVNLRNALDVVQPLVDVTKPVAPKLRQLLVQLKPLAEDSVPTVNDLAHVVSRPGPGQRPDRADQARCSAGCRHRPQRRRERQVTSWGVHPIDDRPQRFDAGARHGASVRGRSDRLVRGLHASRRDRRERRQQPRGPGGRARVGGQRTLEQHPVGDRGLPEAVPRHRVSEREGSVEHRAGRPLSGVDGARGDLLPGERVPV